MLQGDELEKLAFGEPFQEVIEQFEKDGPKKMMEKISP